MASLKVPETIISELINTCFYFVIPLAIVVGLFFRYTAKKSHDEYWEWKRFKKENKCELIEVDSSRFWGAVYTWKTKDGKIIKNHYDR